MRSIRNGNKALQEAHRGGKLCPHPQVPAPSLLTAATLGWWAFPRRSDVGLRCRCSRPPEPSALQKRLRGPSVHAEMRLSRYRARKVLHAWQPGCGTSSHAVGGCLTPVCPSVSLCSCSRD